MSTPMLFVDTCVFKAARRVMQYAALEEITDEFGTLVGKQVPIVKHNYNDAIDDSDDRRERNLVEEAAHLVKAGNLEAVTSNEVLLEFVGLPKTIPATGGMLHGADYRIIPAPVSLGYGLTSQKEDLRHHLEAIKDSRYLEIRKQVGACQGQRRVPLNQLFDALFLWTAEAAGCEYFLTVEKKLPGYPFKSESLKCVRPSGLLAGLR